AEAPNRRRLRGYAFDPQLSTEFATAAINVTTYSVPWEAQLEAGPCGEYVDVVDIDPASGGLYQPVNLDQPSLLAQDGLAPSEGNPQFHQQMVYAVAMRTIENFELALGRRVQWSARMQGADDSYYVQRLRIYPHAFRQRNAYYDPSRKALLFGYFPAGNDDPGRVYPGGTVFTCLSHDIVAHETTHAILDGVHRGLLDASNPDVLAFHEAFADLMALLQHFSLPGVLEQQIAKARGDLRARNLLGELAVQFGEATGRYGALRSAIGRINPSTHLWEPLQPDPSHIDQVTEPHDRGAILVAAVFDAFLTIYERRTEDLVRIGTAGSGVLPPGALHPDLVLRLADEAGRAARQVLHMCIRAVDYCPPVDLTFGDYLRALITADTQLVADDPLHYRIAFVDAFRRRGIYPKGLRSISADALVWDAPSPVVSDVLRDVMLQLGPLVDALAHIDPGAASSRRDAFNLLREWRRNANHMFRAKFSALTAAQYAAVTQETGLDLSPGNAAFEVRSLQLANKIGPEQYAAPQLLIALVQQHRAALDGDSASSFMFKGGCMLVADVRTGLAQYVVRKNIGSAARLASEQNFRVASQESLAGMYLGHASLADNSRTFALLHGLEGDN
ncbi:MAG: peptidase S8, partial [Acidobacteriota bacterium]